MMRKELGSGASSDVIAANIAMYRDIAKTYDCCWKSVLGSELDPTLERDLAIIADSFTPHVAPLSCLDCGAGTGAMTLTMLARGWSVTSVDVSPDMLHILAKKLTARGLKATLVNESVDAFLSKAGPKYHLIGFNSVLHHIYNYPEVIGLAAERLAPGGFLYSNVDPVVPNRPALTELFDSIDTLLAKLLHDRSDLIPGTLRRLRKLLGRPDAVYGRKVASPGDMAEFYARSGIDDSGLIKLMKSKGLTIVEHSRYPLARTPATRYVNRLLKLRQEFKVIARRA